MLKGKVALKIGVVEQGGTVQHMQLCHLVLFPDGREVHDLIGLFQHRIVPTETIQCLTVIRDLPFRQSLLQIFLQIHFPHHLT